ncbi:MAG: CehA/McbA family metallohydrolase [Verrucomicrobiales bacterium]|nr:CehA/McbA family metallohydrolase [Verrucomicrobiales bacterium]
MRKNYLVFGFIFTWLASWAGYRAEASPTIAGLLHPRISEDGSRIVASYHGAIVTVPTEGGNLKSLPGTGSWDIEPAWSPDGKKIAFLRTANFASGQLRLIDAATGELIPLPKPIRGDGKLYFSPDGQRILGLFTGGKNPAQIAWYDLKTAALTPLLIGPEDPATFRRKRIRYASSRDSEFIIYAIHQDEADEQGGNRGPQSDLWRCAADGSNPQQLCTWPARIYDLAISPDNEALILVTDLGSSHNDLWSLPFDDLLTGAERLTSSHADDDRVSVDQSGGQLLWTNNFKGSTELRVRDFESGFERSIPISDIDYGEPTGKLELRLIDGDTGEPVTARVSIKRVGGNFHFPPGALYRLTGSVGHFYVEGQVSLELPLGEYEVRVYHGPEYRVDSRTLTVSNQNEPVSIPLKRWIHMADRKWYSGENHVHANYGYGEWYNKPGSILLQCTGEDLNVCNTVIANSDGDAVYDREFFLGQLDPRSSDNHLVFFGQEFRSTIWGHMTLSNLSQLVEPIMTGFPGTTNPNDVPTNADIAQRASDQGGTIGYTHPAGNLLDLYDQPYSAKGLPVDAAIGRVRLMDIHGHTYDGSTQLWYRLLNTGLPVIGSAGTDVFLNRVRSYPPGWARTYVHLPEGLEYQRWIKRQAEGRSFFTNGPMLEFSIMDAEIGSSISLAKPGPVRVSARVDSPVPLDRVEVIGNGKVLKEIDLGEDRLSAEFTGELMIAESGWIALRAHGPAHPDIIRDPNAHTNPIWISLEGHPNSSASKDAAYFLKWIDRLEADLRKRDRIPTDRQWEQVRAQLDGARNYYRSIR